MRLPLRLRLTLIFTAGMAVVLVGLGAFAYSRIGADFLASVDMGLRSRAQVLVDASEGAEAHVLLAAEGPLIDPDEAFAQILDASGSIVDASSAVSTIPLLGRDDVRALAGPTFMTAQTPGDDPVRLLAVRVQEPPGGVVVVGATLGDMNDALERVLVVLGTIGPATLLVTAGAAWLLAGAALRPVEQMRRQAAAVSASEPGRRLPVPATGDELARLASTLNSMLDRLQESLERERRFVDDASHELRTPLATLRAEIDLALTRKRSARQLEAALQSAQEDVDRLQRLAEDLLVLARSRGGRIPVRRTATPIDELLARAVQSVAGAASAAGVAVEVEAAAMGTVEVDPDRIGQALRNLLENAIRHSPRGGAVRITTARAAGALRVVIANEGPGFPAALLPIAFDPFVRGEGDIRDGGGAGLGLAIVRAVAEAHGGSTWAENIPGGAQVTLSLPG